MHIEENSRWDFVSFFCALVCPRICRKSPFEMLHLDKIARLGRYCSNHRIFRELAAATGKLNGYRCITHIVVVDLYSRSSWIGDDLHFLVCHVRREYPSMICTGGRRLCLVRIRRIVTANAERRSSTQKQRSSKSLHCPFLAAR
jgi:hypothetical protein